MPENAMSRSEASAGLPVVVRANDLGQSVHSVLDGRRGQIEAALTSCGGVLFRGFALDAPNAFHDFATAFGDALLTYDFASTPRSHVGDRIYTSTEYPASQHIPLHNEQSYTRDWPMRIWFHCVIPADAGGATPIADSRRIYNDIPEPIRDAFQNRQVMYVRNYGNGLDLPWETVFNTSHKDDVERYCRERDIVCEWKEDGTLRTRQIAQAVSRHPVTGEAVWFNQAHLFHVSSLVAPVREALLDAVAEEDLPRNAYYGDGSCIEEDVLDRIRAVIARATVTFDWQTNDVLMLDNMLTAHGRAPFKGQRKVLVAMAKPHGELALPQ
ncbi:MAG: hypothetical protein NTAFB05_08600 [Nitrobacter sp.]|uniref:TauD/TfdA family dioxygenase n=1 Tax=Nitrobacter sp. TaxID=29420 RepID=UPI00387DFF5A